MASAPKPRKSALSNTPEISDRNLQKFLEEMRTELIRVSGMAAAALAAAGGKRAGGALTIVQEGPDIDIPTGFGTASLTENGWADIPMGDDKILQVRWGRFQVTNGQNKKIDFGKAFTTACLAVVAGGTNGAGKDAQDNAIDVVTATPPTTTSFQVTSARDKPTTGFYVAIGH